MQGMWVWPLVGELRSHMLQLLSPQAIIRKSERHNEKSHMMPWRSRVPQPRPDADKLVKF